MDSLNQYLLDALAQRPDHDFLHIRREFFTHRYTYAQTKELILQTISYLRQQGVNPGDKIVIWANNMPEWTVLFYACVLEGIVLVPASVLWGKEQTMKVVQEVKPKLVFASLLMPQNADSFGCPVATLEYLFDYLPEMPMADLKSEHDPHSLVEIMYTSGTTGEPKGAMLTRKNFITQINALHQTYNIASQIRTLALLPFSHMYAQIIILLFALKFHPTIYFVPYLSPKLISRALKEYQITHLALVPELLNTFWHRIEATLERKRLLRVFQILSDVARALPIGWRRVLFRPLTMRVGGRLQMFLVGGAKTDQNQNKRWQSLGIQVVEGYGLTETTGVISINTPDDVVLGTAGRPMSGITLKFGEDEEILVKGEVVFPGYYQKLELNNQLFDEEGYFHTGDVGGLDEHGNVVLKGRQKFRIVLSNGEKVYPEDIEHKLNEHPQVVESCVFEVKRNGSPQVAAAVVLAPHADLDAIVAEVNASLEVPQRISHYTDWPTDELPRTPSMKLQRKVIQESAAKLFFKDEVVSPIVEIKNEKNEQILKIMSIVLQRSVESSGRDLLLVKDLGLDSLKRLSLLTLIDEELGIVIDEDALDEGTTVGDLFILAENGVKRKTDLTYSKIHISWPMVLVRFVTRQIYFHTILRYFVRSKIVGHENLEGIAGPCVLMFNHIGRFDSSIVMKSLPWSIQNRLFIIADSNSFRRKLFSFFLHLIGNAYPVKKDGSEIRDTFEFIGEMLDRGWWLLFSPEGNISTDHQLQDFRNGIGYILTESGLPVIPIKIDDPNGIFSGRRKDYLRLPNLHQLVTIKIGEPLTFARSANVEKVAEEAYQAIKNL